MAEPNNIRAFNWLTLELFGQLYDSFPEPMDIDGLRFTIDKVLDLGPESQNADHLRTFPIR